MFKSTVIKNRRLNAYDLEDEKYLCKIFHRPPRHFLLDHPYYPWLPKHHNKKMYNDNFNVNFDLNFQDE
nr:MAG: hypothetical protein [Betatorquevirus sp.]